jgi:hypothetical protein
LETRPGILDSGTIGRSAARNRSDRRLKAQTDAFSLIKGQDGDIELLSGDTRAFIEGAVVVVASPTLIVDFLAITVVHVVSIGC